MCSCLTLYTVLLERAGNVRQGRMWQDDSLSKVKCLGVRFMTVLGGGGGGAWARMHE